MTTITDGTTTITPTLVLGYSSSRQARTLTHEIIGSSADEVTLRPAGPRTGTLRLFFLTEADSAACEDLLCQPKVFTLDDPDLLTIGMKFVPEGRIDRALDDTTRARWIVSADFKEVAP